MSVDRLLRLNELVRRAVSEALPRVLADGELDVAALTVTRVVVSGDLHTARVMVSIFGHVGEREAMMNRLRRHRAELQSIVASQVVIKYTPRLIFELDESVEKGDHILAVLDRIEHEEDGAAGPAAGESANEADRSP